MAEVIEGEGFYCPLCKQDLHSFHLLDAHFREQHEESRGTSKFKSNIKSIFDRAKALGKPKSRFPQPVEDGASAVSGSYPGTEEPPKIQEPVTNVSGIDPSYWPPQEFGACTDYSTSFKRHRDVRLSNTVVETNRLVIRLEKLFRSLKEGSPKTTRHLKAIEQGIVPWHKDDEEKNCTGCGRKFGPSRWKHHCRLCGGIMCKPCSQFMTHTQVYPLISDCPDYGMLVPRTTIRTRRLHLKSQSRSSAKSKREQEEEAIDELRMCPSCARLIHRRLIHLEGLEKPIVAALYEKMQLTMAESERVKPVFLDIAESLLAGDHTHTLNSASQHRQELVKLYESIDSISKQIMSCGADDPSTKEQKLTRSVRIYASNYLQDNLLTLPSLPTVTQLAQIRERVEREAKERIKELERARKEQEMREQYNSEQATLTSTSVLDKILDFPKELSHKVADGLKRESEAIAVPPARQGSLSGWMCSSTVVNSIDSSEDPFDVQRQQLLAYIKQAREAKRMDEVQTLEMSLREIEATMLRERQFTYGFSPPSNDYT